MPATAVRSAPCMSQPGERIQRAQGFVQQQQARLVHQRAGPGHPLALAAGQARRPFIGAVGQADFTASASRACSRCAGSGPGRRCPAPTSTATAAPPETSPARFAAPAGAARRRRRDPARPAGAAACSCCSRRPTTARNWPAGMLRFSPSSTTRSPKRRVRPDNTPARSALGRSSSFITVSFLLQWRHAGWKYEGCHCSQRRSSQRASESTALPSRAYNRMDSTTTSVCKNSRALEAR